MFDDRRRRAGRSGIVGIVLLAVLTVIPTGRVVACSCAGYVPPIADQVGMAEIAFVGRVDASETLEDDATYDHRYELLVEEAVKGVEVGDRVIMFGSSVAESCGTSELDESIVRHAILSRAYSGRFVADSTPPCWPAPTVAELLAADLTLPETSGSPLSVVVSGRLVWMLGRRR